MISYNNVVFISLSKRVNVCYKCYEKYRKFLIYGEVMFCWRKRGKATTFISIIPLIFPLFPNCLEGNGMRNGGKVVVVHILFFVCVYIFSCLANPPFPPLSNQR